MTKSTKSTKLAIILTTVLLCICVAIVTVGTVSELNDSKTATGTLTFNLADYDMYVALESNVDGNIAPGCTGYTTTMKAVNSYKTTDGTLYGTAADGATVSMSGVYVKMTITSITVGDATLSQSTYSYADGYLTIASSNGLTIKLIANTYISGVYWYVDSGSIYLMDGYTSSASKTTLAFSDSSVNETAANIQFEISITDPEVNNGFNASGTSSNTVNDYQGKAIAINYTLSWGTTVANLEAVTIS